jgi:NAD(P)H-quinone oxidoreductase subunit 5
MPPSIASLAFIAPVALAGVALIAVAEPGLRPRRCLRAAHLATIGALLISVAVAALVAWRGPMTSPVIGGGDLGLSVRLDALSAVMFLLVSFVGVIVIQFSRNYLDGDARQGRFIGRLCLTLAAVSLLVLAGNLCQLVAAWIATSLALHRLLIFYPGRLAAVTAARKKFITARIGDACLISAAVLLATAFGTTDIATILKLARSFGQAAIPPCVSAASPLIAAAALLKSAQFPAHGWLPEVMETPTPVSALLHAGIINAGGFLVIRFADVMLLSAPSLHLLAIVGGFTALFGSVVMLTQTSVKVSLAWSTVAQMGFMLLQCGLGAFSFAVLHIVAHSLYKAHAFLASGSVVDIARSAWVPDLKVKPHAGHLLASLMLALGLYAGIGWLFDLFVGEAIAVLVLGAILVMGVSLLIVQSWQGRTSAYVIGRTAVAAGCATAAYFVLQAGAAWLMAPTLPGIPAPGAVGIAIMALAVVIFAAITVLQVLAPVWADAPAWRATRVHLANGLYANALFNRLVGALKRPAAGPS